MRPTPLRHTRQICGRLSNCTFKYEIEHPRISDYIIFCIVSDADDWEHISVSIQHPTKGATRCPTWEEMSYVRYLFWDDTETVMQLHPPLQQYVNNHEYCLHLWKPKGKDIPLPNPLMVGIPNKQSLNPYFKK